MSNNLYIAATEPRSGKSVVCLGLMELLFRNVESVGFFRPIINVDPSKNQSDNDISLIAAHFKLGTPYKDMYAYTAKEAKYLISVGKQAELLEGILNKYNELASKYDFVLCEGIEFEGATASFDFDLNAEISNNLGCPVLLVANAFNKDADEIVRSVMVYRGSLVKRGCKIVAIVVNRINKSEKNLILKQFVEKGVGSKELIYAIPNDKTLENSTIAEIAAILDAKILYGKDKLDRPVKSFTVAAMELHNFLARLSEDTLVVTPGDRADVILACLASLSSDSIPNISGILLTGGLVPEDPIHQVIKDFKKIIPIIGVKDDTFIASRNVDNIHSVITPDNKRKIISSLAIFENNIVTSKLAQRIIQTKSSIVTPKMFEYRLIQRARKHKQSIVLPEGEEERILRASEILCSRDVVNLILLGNKKRIQNRALSLGINIDKVSIIEPEKSEYFEDYARTYYEMRKHKGITLEQAYDIMSDWSFFGTMMVQKGHADGMVSGAIHTTGDTIRPALQIIKTRPGCSIVSSVFLMCLKDRVLVYGDCAVNPNPNAQQLAEIAISSAQTTKTFGIEPRVAMLSYSTGSSGKGADVEKVREAVKIAREKSDLCPTMKLEGPIQYDAAVDPDVAVTKMPNSEVAGKATVFIFPDLNTGNNTYKAVQRSANAVAIGPVLQGLKKPINDLSRGCLVADIVNTIAITAIQAQANKKLSKNE